MGYGSSQTFYGYQNINKYDEKFSHWLFSEEDFRLNIVRVFGLFHKRENNILENVIFKCVRIIHLSSPTCLSNKSIYQLF